MRRGKISYLIDILNHIDRQIEAHGGYEQDVLSHFIRFAKDFNPSIFIDVGANLGLYSMAIAKEFTEIKVIAFEPDRRNIGQLHANIFLNDLQDKISVHEVALSENDGYAPFLRFGEENRGRSRLYDSGNLLVPVKRLDSLFNYKENQIAIKVDAEGHELSVLKGSEELLRRNNCIIQIESFHLQPVRNFLEFLGYHQIFSTKSEFIFIR